MKADATNTTTSNSEPNMKNYQLPCPYCGCNMDADWVDVGVGLVQCGPYHCFSCGASEIGPEIYEPRFEASQDEIKTGFYRGRISPHANQVNGVPIDYKTADAIYRAKYFAEHGNPHGAPIIRHSY